MGVYINMEMPTKGYRLILVHSDGTAQTTDGETTAISVPPHGRLVDADELFKEMERKGWFDNADRDNAEDLVLAATTIIPVEPPKEET